MGTQRKTGNAEAGAGGTTACMTACLPELDDDDFRATQGATRLAWALAQELRDHRVASLALAPGFTATERVQAAFERNPKMADEDGGFRPTEPPPTPDAPPARRRTTSRSSSAPGDI